MAPRRLEIRGTLERDYADVYTPEALAALNALAHFDADRKALMTARSARRAARARERRRIAFLDPAATIGRTTITVQDARDGKFEGSEIPADLQRQWIQGTGPAARPGTPVATNLRNVAYALLSGADGWMFDGEDALGQVSTMSLDNQRSLKLAIDRAPVFLEVAEQVAAEMNQWAEGFLGRRTIADWRQQLGFTTKIFRARGLHLDDRHVRHAGRRRLLGLDRRRRAVPRQQPRRPAAVRRVAGPVSAEDPDRRGGRAVERHPDGARSTPRPAGGHGQGLRAGRAGGGLLPADGDPRRARPALRRLQHRALGLHQQRLGRDGVGSGVRQPEHRRDHDDLRLHAELRGPRAAGRQHARPERALRAVAGRDGAEHPGGVGGRRRRRDGARDRRGRARAARGRQRQVGGALEDGAHRAAGVGEGGRRQPARAAVSASDLHAGGRRRAAAARAGAAHRSAAPGTC